MEREIIKTKDGFIEDMSDETLTYFAMHYDKCGTYVGQTQENMFDNDPPSFFFKPEMIDGNPCVNGEPIPPLTKEQMRRAK